MATDETALRPSGSRALTVPVKNHSTWWFVLRNELKRKSW